MSRILSRLDGRLGLLLVALGLLVVASVDPSARLPRGVYKYLFVLDITQSMNVQDAGPPDQPVRRLEWAREAVRVALQRLPCGSQAGLAIFTEYRAFLLFAPVEVCQSYGTIAAILQDIDWNMAWAARSEVAKGLYSSLLAARELGEGTRLVFLTDGHEAPPLHPDIRPQFTGTPGEVRGAIIGVGRLQPMPIPRLDAEGKILGYWTADEVLQVDPFSLGRSTTVQGEQMVGIEQDEVARRIARGTEHLSALNEPYLQQLAAQTSLEYYRLESPRGFADFLTLPKFAQVEVAMTDLRWIAGSLGILALSFVYLANMLRPMRASANALVLCVLILAFSAAGETPAAETYTRERVAALLSGGEPNFENANLRGLDLSGLDFHGVNLRAADLAGASLRDCNLDLAIFREAVLSGADLRGASLFSTVFADARLTGADLRDARLVGNFTGADMERANLSGVRGGADMRNQPMGLMRAILAQARLAGANLAGADLSRADLTFADLSEADLSEANLMRAELTGTNLSGADLSNANLTGAEVENADFTGVIGLETVQGFDSVVGKEHATFD